jgi:hypothetical protein
MLALLGDHLRLYQIHSATIESRVLDEAVLDELAPLRERRLAIGLTVKRCAAARGDRACQAKPRPLVPKKGDRRYPPAAAPRWLC